MSIETLQRQYSEVVAPYYDLDPQGVTRRSLKLALDQIREQQVIGSALENQVVLDLGMGTGLFLEKLKSLAGEQLQLYGCDLAQGMVQNAQRKMPELNACVDDAANLDTMFPEQTFDLICSHFITGFVPIRVLAPKIHNRLSDGGYWSLVGGTKAGFPALQAKTKIKWLRSVCGAGALQLDEELLNPASLEDAEEQLKGYGFEICHGIKFAPEVDFPNFDKFMEFGYQGGWFTPLIEKLGLNKAGAVTRFLLNRFMFPVKDNHDIVIVLARKARN
jgi:SAM-dependent methyltransferase